MAEKCIANVEDTCIAICIAPDWCYVGGTLVPFDSSRILTNVMVASPNVKARGSPVYRIGDLIRGTDSNAGSGIISQTSREMGNVHIRSDNTTVRVNGMICARHDSLVDMNVGPCGPNTIGKLVTGVGQSLVSAVNGFLHCNNPPKSSDLLKSLQEQKELNNQFSKYDPVAYYTNNIYSQERLDNIDQKLDKGIAWLDVENRGFISGKINANLQMLRGVLGGTKDTIMGLGYGSRSNIQDNYSPTWMGHKYIDYLIQMENIRLGNTCVEDLKNAALAKGQAMADGIIKPITNAWDKGNKIEAISRGVTEVASLVIGGVAGDAGKIARLEALAGKLANIEVKAETALVRTGATSGAGAGEAASTAAVKTAGAVTGEAAGASTGSTSGAVAGEAAGTAAGKTTGAVTGEAAGASTGATTGAAAGGTLGKSTGAAAGPATGETAGSVASETSGGATSAGESAAVGENASGAKPSINGEPPNDGQQVNQSKPGGGTKILKNNNDKGAFGEEKAHKAMVDKGYKPIGKTDGIYHKGQTGIDGVYKNPNPPPDYIITEVKYNTSNLSKKFSG